MYSMANWITCRCDKCEHKNMIPAPFATYHKPGTSYYCSECSSCIAGRKNIFLNFIGKYITIIKKRIRKITSALEFRYKCKCENEFSLIINGYRKNIYSCGKCRKEVKYSLLKALILAILHRFNKTK